MNKHPRERNHDTYCGRERGGAVALQPPPPWLWLSRSCCIPGSGRPARRSHLRRPPAGGGSTDRSTRAGRAHPRPWRLDQRSPRRERVDLHQDARRSSAERGEQRWLGLGFVRLHCQTLRILPFCTTRRRSRDMTRDQGCGAPLQTVSYSRAHGSEEEGHLTALTAAGRRTDQASKHLLGARGKRRDVLSQRSLGIGPTEETPESCETRPSSVIYLSLAAGSEPARQQTPRSTHNKATTRGQLGDGIWGRRFRGRSECRQIWPVAGSNADRQALFLVLLVAWVPIRCICPLRTAAHPCVSEGRRRKTRDLSKQCGNNVNNANIKRQLIAHVTPNP